jgi:hypothetical protein
MDCFKGTSYSGAKPLDVSWLFHWWDLSRVAADGAAAALRAVSLCFSE